MKGQEQRQRKKEQGFTLVEILVAIAILAFGLLAVSTMQISGLGGSHRANSATEVSTLAMDCMEKIVGMKYGEAALYGTVSEVQNGYTVNSNVAAGTLDDTLAITVTVNGRGRAITLNWIKAEIVQVQ